GDDRRAHQRDPVLLHGWFFRLGEFPIYSPRFRNPEIPGACRPEPSAPAALPLILTPVCRPRQSARRPASAAAPCPAASRHGPAACPAAGRPAAACPRP